jgi:hypothetical protein
MQGSTARQPESYRFTVDGKPFDSTQRVITGSDLRRMAGLDNKVRIFFGDHRDETNAERQIHNTTSVDLSEPGEERFYTLAGPTMDIY